MEEILNKLSEVKTMPELDALRHEVAYLMCGPDTDKATFDTVQKAFIKAKNKMKRIPLVDRTW